jgi:hypothetical protein
VDGFSERDFVVLDDADGDQYVSGDRCVDKLGWIGLGG